MVRRVSRRNYRSKRVKSGRSRSLRKRVRSKSVRKLRRRKSRRMRGGKIEEGAECSKAGASSPAGGKWYKCVNTTPTVRGGHPNAKLKWMYDHERTALSPVGTESFREQNSRHHIYEDLVGQQPQASPSAGTENEAAGDGVVTDQKP